MRRKQTATEDLSKEDRAGLVSGAMRRRGILRYPIRVTDEDDGETTSAPVPLSPEMIEKARSELPKLEAQLREYGVVLGETPWIAIERWVQTGRLP